MSSEAVARVVSEMMAAFDHLGNYPLIGKVRSELRGDLRSFPVSSYIVFYRALSEGVEVVRIRHQHQHPTRGFKRT